MGKLDFQPLFKNFTLNRHFNMMVSERNLTIDLFFINRKTDTDICIYTRPKCTINSDELSTTKGTEMNKAIKS